MIFVRITNCIYIWIMRVKLQTTKILRHPFFCQWEAPPYIRHNDCPTYEEGCLYGLSTWNRFCFCKSRFFPQMVSCIQMDKVSTAVGFVFFFLAVAGKAADVYYVCAQCYGYRLATWNRLISVTKSSKIYYSHSIRRNWIFKLNLWCSLTWSALTAVWLAASLCSSSTDPLKKKSQKWSLTRNLNIVYSRI